MLLKLFNNEEGNLGQECRKAGFVFKSFYMHFKLDTLKNVLLFTGPGNHRVDKVSLFAIMKVNPGYPVMFNWGWDALEGVMFSKHRLLHQIFDIKQSMIKLHSFFFPSGSATVLTSTTPGLKSDLSVIFLEAKEPYSEFSSKDWVLKLHTLVLRPQA